MMGVFFGSTHPTRCSNKATDMTDAADLTDDPRVIAALRGHLPVEDLSDAERVLFYDLIGFADPLPATRAFLAELRKADDPTP